LESLKTGMMADASPRLKPVVGFSLSGNNSEHNISVCKEIVSALLAHEHSWIFAEPVDPSKLNIPLYFEVVRAPMDLGTIMEKLQRQTYFSVIDFARDLQLVWKNAKAFNQSESLVYKLASKFERDCIAQLNAAPFQSQSTCTVCRGLLATDDTLIVCEVCKRQWHVFCFCDGRNATYDNGSATCNDCILDHRLEVRLRSGTSFCSGPSVILPSSIAEPATSVTPTASTAHGPSAPYEAAPSNNTAAAGLSVSDDIQARKRRCTRFEAGPARKRTIWAPLWQALSSVAQAQAKHLGRRQQEHRQKEFPNIRRSGEHGPRINFASSLELEAGERIWVDPGVGHQPEPLSLVSHIQQRALVSMASENETNGTFKGTATRIAANADRHPPESTSSGSYAAEQDQLVQALAALSPPEFSTNRANDSAILQEHNGKEGCEGDVEGKRNTKENGGASDQEQQQRWFQVFYPLLRNLLVELLRGNRNQNGSHCSDAALQNIQMEPDASQQEASDFLCLFLNKDHKTGLIQICEWFVNLKVAQSGSLGDQQPLEEATRSLVLAFLRLSQFAVYNMVVKLTRKQKAEYHNDEWECFQKAFEALQMLCHTHQRTQSSWFGKNLRGHLAYWFIQARKLILLIFLDNRHKQLLDTKDTTRWLIQVYQNLRLALDTEHEISGQSPLTPHEAIEVSMESIGLGFISFC